MLEYTSRKERLCENENRTDSWKYTGSEPLSLFSGFGWDLIWTNSRTNLWWTSWQWSSTLLLCQLTGRWQRQACSASAEFVQSPNSTAHRSSRSRWSSACLSVQHRWQDSLHTVPGTRHQLSLSQGCSPSASPAIASVSSLA